MKQNKDYLITEKPSRALLIFSIPMIIGNLFQQAYTIVDSAIVGRYVGETALAAVGASYALTSIFICIASRTSFNLFISSGFAIYPFMPVFFASSTSSAKESNQSPLIALPHQTHSSLFNDLRFGAPRRILCF